MNLNHQQRRAFLHRGRKNPWAAANRAVRKMPWRKRERCTMAGLLALYAGHAICYAGDIKLARAAHCSPSSVHRAKLGLERLHVLQLAHSVGGWTRNAKGEHVRNATGYAPHPDLYAHLTMPAAERSKPKDARARAAAAPAGAPQTFEQYAAESRAGP